MMKTKMRKCFLLSEVDVEFQANVELKRKFSVLRA